MIKERVTYPDPLGFFWESAFWEVCDRALRLARENPCREAEPLEYLHGVAWPGPENIATRQGATFKSLAYVAHRMGMSDPERQRWYELARSIPLSQAHVGCIIAGLGRAEDAISGLEKMLRDEAASAA